jgi:predicted dehydrogenase
MAEKHSKNFIDLRCSLEAVYHPKEIKSSFFKSFKHIISFEDLDNVDYEFIIISSPNYYHTGQINYFLNKKKILFVEKPFVINFEGIIGGEDDLTKNIFVSFNLRYQKNTQKLKELLNQNFINKGNVLREINVKWLRNQKLDFNKWFFDKKLSGGGILIDWGVHCIDLISFLLNLNNFTRNELKFENFRNDIECSCNGIFFIDDIKVKLNLSWVEKHNIEPLNIEFIFENSEVIKWSKDGGLYLKYNNHDYERIFNSNKSNMYNYFLEEYLSEKLCFKATENKKTNFLNYKNTQIFLEDIYKKLSQKT